jgi:hypothetical protein
MGSAAVQTVDPFGTAGRQNNDCSAGGATGCLIKDTVANLTVKIADVGGGSARLINVCSYPSQEPNSDPSDCVITPNSGFLNIVKAADPDDETPFVFNASASSQSGVSSWTINGSGSQLLISYAATTTLDLNEVVPSGWQLDDAACAIAEGGGQTPIGSETTTGVDNITIKPGLETTCTFNDSKWAKLTIVKDAVPDDGQDFVTTTGTACRISAWTTMRIDLSNTEIFDRDGFGNKATETVR